MPPLQLVSASPATGTTGTTTGATTGSATGGTSATGGPAAATPWHVPQVVGQPVDAVRRALAPYRLQVVQQAVYSDRPVDEVVGTEPPPGATAPDGSRLVVKVSVGLPAGPVDVGQELVLLNRQVGAITDRLMKRDVRVAVTAGVVAGIVAALAAGTRSGGGSGPGGGAPGATDPDATGAGESSAGDGDGSIATHAGGSGGPADAGGGAGGGKSAGAGSGARGRTATSNA